MGRDNSNDIKHRFGYWFASTTGSDEMREQNKIICENGTRKVGE